MGAPVSAIGGAQQREQEGMHDVSGVAEKSGDWDPRADLWV